MFKNRNILILAVVLLVLLGISLMQKADYRKNTSRPTTVKIVEGVVTADQLDRITLGQGDNEEAVVLLSTPTGWVVASAWDAPVNTQRLEALLRSVSDLSAEFRSDKASVLADYGLADDGSVKVRAYGKDGQLAVAVDIGSKPENAPGNFVRSPGSNAVYLSQVNLLSQLGIYGEPELPGRLHFIDLQAVKEDRLAVDSIVLDSEGQVLELTKDFPEAMPEVDLETAEEGAADLEAQPPVPDRTTWEWKLTAPQSKALAKTKVDGLLGSVVSVRAVDIDDPTGDLNAYGLAEPSRTATLILQDGSEVVLEFGNMREAEGDVQAGVWMKVRGQSAVWVVTEHTVNNVFKSVEDLLPEE